MADDFEQVTITQQNLFLPGIPPPHEFINKSVLDALCEIRKSGLTPEM